MSPKLLALVGFLALLVMPARGAGMIGYPCYRTMPELLDSLTNLVSTYPDLVRWTNVGVTVENRQILGVVVSKQTAPGPKYPVLFTGTIHAAELSPPEFLVNLAERLCAGYATNGNYRYVLDYSEVHIIPVVNIDSKVKADASSTPLSLVFRNNQRDVGCSVGETNGVNINRNFPYDFALSDPCNSSYSGPSAASEPETQAVTNYCHALFADVRGPALGDSVSNTVSGLIIDLHTQANTILYYYPETGTTPNDAQFLSLARKGRHYTGYAINSLSYTTGTMKNTGFGIWGVPTLTWEFGPINGWSCANYTNTTRPANEIAIDYMLRAGRQPFNEPKFPEITNIVASLDGTTLTISGAATDSNNDAATDHDIAGIRYSIGLPTWHSGATPGSLSYTKTTTGNATFTGTVDVSALPGGDYVVYADATDTSDPTTYGITSAAVFTIDGDPPVTSVAVLRGNAAAIRGNSAAWRTR